MRDASGGAFGPSVGADFAGHRIEAVIGGGGMGVVYRARNLALDRARALKVLAPTLSSDSRFRARFRRESRLAASIEHPNVIPVHEAGEEDGQLYLSMRLVAGRDLRELVATGGPLEPHAAAEIIAAVAAGLDAAHQSGLIHRDVKPANVLVGEGGDAGRVYLTDFGISRTTRAGETLTESGELIGTADFIAPEQIAGDPVDHRADIYALGAVLCFALTGEPPFKRDNELAVLFAHANAPRPRPSGAQPQLPAAVDRVVARAMAVDPGGRPESAAELAAELRGALSDGGAPTVPLTAPAGSRRRWVVPAVLAALAAAAVTTAWVVLGGDQSDRGATVAGSGAGPPPEVAATIAVGAGPIGVTVGERRVWVAVRDRGALVGIDPDADRSATPVPIPTPSSVAVGFGSVWAVSGDGFLYRLDPAQGELRRFEVGVNPSDVAVDRDWVWVTVEGERRVLRFDPRSNQQAGTVAVGDGPRAVATGAGAVWVTNIEDGSISKIDPEESRRVGSSVAVDGSRPSDIAVGAGSVWAVDVLGGRLIEIDPGSALEPPRLAGEPIQGFNRPRGVKVGFGAVWVVSGGDSSLLRLDPASGRTTASVGVGDEPADLALGANAVWTANEDGDTVTRVAP